MKKAIIPMILGLGGISLFTVLLVNGKISEISYVALMVPLALVCIVLLCLPRLRELDLKNLRMTLSELKQVKSEIEEVKTEITEMYGGIENLKKEPLILNDFKMKELGLEPNPLQSAMMRYTVGCVKRERERLARVFVKQKPSEKLAEAIVDNSMDAKVFKWNGPEASLDAEPVSVEQRKQKKEE